MKKGPLSRRLMTAEEIEFCSYLKDIKIPDWSGEKYIHKALMKHLASNPPMIVEKRVISIYRLLIKYRRQIPKITTRNEQGFWAIVDRKLNMKRKPVLKGKTLVEVFAEEQKEHPDEKLDIEKLFDQFHKVKQ